MKFLRCAVLYAALGLGANAALADFSAITPLREGDMKKLMFHSAPKDTSDAVFFDEDGREHTLAEYHGQYVLLNFWATWCAPCRKEMPSLDALQNALGGDRFQVVPIATGRNMVPAIHRFFDQVGVTNLPVLLAPKQRIAHEMAVLGLPVSVIIDPDGREIARLRGDADWASESATNILTTLIAQP